MKALNEVYDIIKEINANKPLSGKEYTRNVLDIIHVSLFLFNSNAFFSS